jgi:hypothetical protein
MMAALTSASRSLLLLAWRRLRTSNTCDRFTWKTERHRYSSASRTRSWRPAPAMKYRRQTKRVLQPDDAGVRLAQDAHRARQRRQEHRGRHIKDDDLIFRLYLAVLVEIWVTT